MQPSITISEIKGAPFTIAVLKGWTTFSTTRLKTRFDKTLSLINPPINLQITKYSLRSSKIDTEDRIFSKRYWTLFTISSWNGFRFFLFGIWKFSSKCFIFIFVRELIKVPMNGIVYGSIIHFSVNFSTQYSASYFFLIKLLNYVSSWFKLSSAILFKIKTILLFCFFTSDKVD